MSTNNIGTVTNFTVIPKSKSSELMWTDPDDVISDGLVADFWSSTKILRKTSGYPTSITDGVVVVSSTIRNQYQSEPFIDTGLDDGTMYYYSAFTVGSHVNDTCFSQESCNSKVFVASYKEMTININFGESDPTKMCNYSDDAVGAPCGLTDEATTFWKEFFGYRPCLFKDGAVVGYLNPNDYTKFEDGTTADITSGNSGSVMIEYPRRGVKFTKSGKIVSITVTSKPTDETGFTYYAHSRGSTPVQNFYLGAYISTYGSLNGSNYACRSLSGSYPRTGISMNTSQGYCNSNGNNYGLMAFYQFLYIQIMYCFQFSNNLNCFSVLGYGKGTTTFNCGTADTKGLVYGTPFGNGDIKLFGLEDPWGVGYQWLNGVYLKTTGTYVGNTKVDTTSISTTLSPPVRPDNLENVCSQRGTISSSGYVSDVFGTSELGFCGKEFNGASNTYTCASLGYGKSYTYIMVASCWSNNEGVFDIDFACGISDAQTYGCSRLMYL